MFLAYLDVCFLKQLQLDEAANREPHAEVLLAACATRELVYWFLEQEAADRRYLLPEQARSICNHGDEYLKYAEKLSIYASTHSILRWKVLPKMHAARPYNICFHIFRANRKFPYASSGLQASERRHAKISDISKKLSCLRRRGLCSPVEKTSSKYVFECAGREDAFPLPLAAWSLRSVKRKRFRIEDAIA